MQFPLRRLNVLGWLGVACIAFYWLILLIPRRLVNLSPVLGLSPETLTYVHVMESVAPGVVGAIDYSVRRRLIDKLNMMATALEDIDLRQLALDEQEGDEPIDYDITLDDIIDLISELSGTAPEPGEELV